MDDLSMMSNDGKVGGFIDNVCISHVYFAQIVMFNGTVFDSSATITKYLS